MSQTALLPQAADPHTNGNIIQFHDGPSLPLQELIRLVSDCTHPELKVITETVRTLKENLRQLRPKG